MSGVDYILAADHEQEEDDGSDDGSNDNGAKKSDASDGEEGGGGDEEKGEADNKADPQSKKSKKKKSKKKKKKANTKKNGKKKENGGRIGGTKPYSDYTDEAPDMLKFDDDKKKKNNNAKKKKSGGGGYTHVIGSDDEEDDEEEDSSSEEDDSDDEDSDDDDDSSDDDDDDSDDDESASLESIDSEDVRNIRDRAHGLIDEDSVEARVRIRKKRDQQKKFKEKEAKRKARKKERRRKAKAAERGAPGPGLFRRMAGAFKFPTGAAKAAKAKAKGASEEDERIPMTALDAQGMSGGSAAGGRSYGDWDPRASTGTPSVNTQRDFEDLDGSLEGGIRVYDSVRYVDPRAKRRRRKRCCLFALVLTVMTGAGLAIWLEWGNLGNVKKWFRGKGKGKGKSSSAGGAGKSTGTGGKGGASGTTSKAIPPFDVDADVMGICSDEDVATFQGYYACRGLCDSAYCCFLPPWESHSCSRTFDSQCYPYVEACAVLDRVEQPRSPGAAGGDNAGQVKENALPPADPNLPAFCSGKDQTKSGLEKCSEACEPGLCCFAGLSEFSKEHDCYMDNKYACAAYHPCIDAVAFRDEIDGGAAVEGGGLNVSTASGGTTVIHLHNWRFERRRLILEQACSERGMVNSGACERYCVGYECCYGEEKGADTAETCHDEKTCMDMAACANLLKPGGEL